MSSAVAIAERPKSCCSRWAPQTHGRAGVGALSDTGWAGSLSGTAAGASPPPTGWSRTPAVRTTSSCANGPSASPTSRTDATSRSEQLENGGVRHTAAFAHGLQSVANAVLPHVVDQRGHQPGAGAAERVAECDRAAVWVHRLHVGAGLDLPGLDHSGERLVDLDRADLVQPQPRARERLRRCRDRPGQDGDRVHAGQREGVEPRHRGEPQLAGLLAGHHQQGRGPVGDLRGVPGGDDAVLGEGPLERAQSLHLSLIHISEPTRLLSISYAVFCLKKKKKTQKKPTKQHHTKKHQKTNTPQTQQ